MIITLKGANFSLSNIGTLTTWNIQYSLGTGASTTSVTSVDRDASYFGTITIASGYELGSAGVTVTMGGNPVTSGITTSGNTITVSISKVTGRVIINVPTKNIATGEEEEPEIPDTPDTPVTPPATGDTGTIRWTNHGYQNGTGLVDRPARAMARMAAVKNDIIRIEGLEGFTMVDLVAFDADGETALGYTGATTGGINLTYVDGVATFQVPASSSFTNCAYVGLVIKYASEATIDVSTLPTTYSKVLLPVVNQKFDSKTFTMIADGSRMALRELVEVKANRTITIANIPETYVNDLSPVDMVFYNTDKTYKKYSSSYTMNFSGSNLVITIPSSTEIGTYVNVTMKCTSDPSSAIKTIKFINSTVTSA